MFLHPSSTNFKVGEGFQYPFLVYNDIVTTAKTFVRDSTMVKCPRAAAAARDDCQALLMLRRRAAGR